MELVFKMHLICLKLIFNFCTMKALTDAVGAVHEVSNVSPSDVRQ